MRNWLEYFRRRNRPNQGRFAGTRQADDRDELAGPNVQIDTIQCGKAAILRIVEDDREIAHGELHIADCICRGSSIRTGDDNAPAFPPLAKGLDDKPRNAQRHACGKCDP